MFVRFRARHGHVLSGKVISTEPYYRLVLVTSGTVPQVDGKVKRRNGKWIAAKVPNHAVWQVPNDNILESSESPYAAV